MPTRRIIIFGLPFVLLLVVIGLITLPLGVALAVEKAFPPTASGQFEIKQLPAGVLLEASSNEPYFNTANSLFRPLFSYISERKIAMTTPVEAHVKPGRMYFWVAADEVEKVDGDTQSIRVIQIPSRMVAAAGGRGAYSEENYNQTRERLLTWLAEQKQWKTVGEPFAVYWNGPFTLSIFKRYEVQVEVMAEKGDLPLCLQSGHEANGSIPYFDNSNPEHLPPVVHN